MQDKRLYKGSHRMVAGVCSGIAEYFNVDPTIIRLAMAVFACTGGGILAYIICAIVIPDPPM